MSEIKHILPNGRTSGSINVGDRIEVAWIPGRLFWLVPGRVLVPYPKQDGFKIVRVP